MLVAIIFEVVGTLTMKYNAEFAPLTGLILMYVMLSVSYAALAIAVKRIPLAVAYGAWESLGMVLITIFSMLLFAEPLNGIKAMGMLIIVTGIILLKIGTVKKMR